MTADANRYAGPAYVKLSPTRIITALACPRKYKHRYVDGLEPARMPSALAFGRAVHAALAAAYARQNAPLDSDGVADAFGRHFAFLDEQGITYKDRESYEDLDAKGRALVAKWHAEYGEAEIPETKVIACETELSHDIEPGLAVHGHVDLIEERDGLLYICDHKTVASWGESDEVLYARSTQLTMYAYLCLKTYGRLADRLYITVLKKTKAPEVKRYFTERSAAEIAAFEDYARGVAALIRFHDEAGTYPRNYSRDCAWCGFNSLCFGLEGAAEMFVSREERKEKAAQAAGV
jgi:CRISPR/Cas system-associated exonuclease Cas4 (RecB family)